MSERKSRRLEEAKDKLAYSEQLAKEARAELENETPPFRVGDVVQLKSGGHPMVVERCAECCQPPGRSEPWQVQVVWAEGVAGSDLSRDYLNPDVLRLLPSAECGLVDRPSRDDWGDIPG